MLPLLDTFNYQKLKTDDFLVSHLANFIPEMRKFSGFSVEIFL